MQEVKIGMTDYSVLVFIPDPASTDGSGKTGLVAANLTVSGTRVETDNDIVVTDYTSSLNDLGALTTAHTDWGLKEVSSTLAPGLYRLDIADAIFASGAWSAVVYVMITSSAAVATPMEFILIPTSPIDGVKPADGSIVAATFGAGAINAAAIADGAIDAATFAAGAITATVIADGAIDAATFAANAITSTVIADNAITANKIASDAITDAKVAADVTIASVTGAVGSVTGNVGGNVTGTVGSVVGAVGSVTGLTAADVGAIKTKTDSLTFTKALELDANLQSVNGVTVNGDGAGTPMGV